MGAENVTCVSLGPVFGEQRGQGGKNQHQNEQYQPHFAEFVIFDLLPVIDVHGRSSRSLMGLRNPGVDPRIQQVYEVICGQDHHRCHQENSLHQG